MGLEIFFLSVSLTKPDKTMKLWFLLIHAFHAEKVCPAKSRVGEYRSYVEQLITKVSKNRRYFSQNDCERTMIGFNCRKSTGSSYRFCETHLYRFASYAGNLRANTFPPSAGNNYRGQKCVLKTVIYKPDEKKRGKIKRVMNECYKWTPDNQTGFIHATWSQWSQWTPCSVTCGNGSRFKTRKCFNNEMEVENEFCGDAADSQIELGCNEGACSSDSSQELIFKPKISETNESSSSPPPVTQRVLIKTEFAFLDTIDSCFTFSGQRDPDGKIIETEKSCIEKALASLSENDITQPRIKMILTSLTNRLLQLGAEFESVAETHERDDQSIKNLEMQLNKLREENRVLKNHSN